MNAERKQEIRAAVDAIPSGKVRQRHHGDSLWVDGADVYLLTLRTDNDGSHELAWYNEATADFFTNAPDYVRELLNEIESAEDKARKLELQLAGTELALKTVQGLYISAEAEIARLRAALEQINGLHVYQLGEAYTIADRALNAKGEK